MEALLLYNSESESDEELEPSESPPRKRSCKGLDNSGKNGRPVILEGGAVGLISNSASREGTVQIGSGISLLQSTPKHEPFTERSGSKPSAIAGSSKASLPGLPFSNHSAPTALLSPLPGSLQGSESQRNTGHQGRVRKFPHVEGNYATHVYIPVKVPRNFKTTLTRSLQRAKMLFPALQPMEGLSGNQDCNAGLSRVLEPADSYHISLSRTVPIKHYQIESLVEMLKENFMSQKRFALKLAEWQAFVNDDSTRSFLALGTTHGTEQICEQVRLVNEAFAVHELPVFYKEPRPHVSVAWCLEERLADLKQICGTLDVPCNPSETDPSNWENGSERWGSEVRRVECKIGKKIYVIWSG
ncbi:hypothetical protein KFL_001510200 [Klebsormidium nitens]|uniref:U6 snRNA phosphodiesterase 1 n=1 Tax=Klebsormidium nitens TaxID=105231 RepID=A0A1Y1I443_KLENI|nr:hypothetical protein KFL_001510200 [Klebsormidium nitens]|eukprot:GAQ83517.1 hypothetical protein KFL_001510200 [Klebsormidium nitens]